MDSVGASGGQRPYLVCEPIVLIVGDDLAFWCNNGHRETLDISVVGRWPWARNGSGNACSPSVGHMELHIYKFEDKGEIYLYVAESASEARMMHHEEMSVDVGYVDDRCKFLGQLRDDAPVKCFIEGPDGGIIKPARDWADSKGLLGSTV